MSRGKILLVEALVLIVVSAALGLTANGFAPRALRLYKDYFPKRHNAANRASDAGTSTQPAAAKQGDGKPSSADASADTSEGLSVDVSSAMNHGLQSLSSRVVAKYAEDAPNSNGQVVFVDARSDSDYADGHIPGALHVYHYDQEKYLPDVLPALENAEVVVVYCGGGDCEDSIYLATDLIYEHQLPYDHVFLYEGGMHDWLAKHRAVRTGDQP